MRCCALPIAAAAACSPPGSAPGTTRRTRRARAAPARPRPPARARSPSPLCVSAHRLSFVCAELNHAVRRRCCPCPAGVRLGVHRSLHPDALGLARLGVFDPLGLIETRDMRRYEIMEIKHGRAAMLGFLHVIAIEAGVRVPGYLSTSQNLKFSDVPAGCFA